MKRIRWIDVWAIGAGALVLCGMALVFLLLNALTAHGQGVAASQPASQPGAAVGAWSWFCANVSWLVPLVIWFLSSVCTGLSNYPKADGVVKVLRLIMAGLSIVEFKDGKKPGLAFKLPVTPPAPPPEAKG